MNSFPPEIVKNSHISIVPLSSSCDRERCLRPGPGREDRPVCRVSVQTEMGRHRFSTALWTGGIPRGKRSKREMTNE